MTKGVISAGGKLTAEAGAEMLRLGGNAVDAAIAAAFMSFFAEIAMVHWGGSGIAVLHDAKTGENQVYDFFSNMPGIGRKTPPAQLDFGPTMIDFGATTQEFHLGRASVAVPGNIFGLCELAEEKGSLPLAVLLGPSIAATRAGIEINSYQAATCKLLESIFTHTAPMRAIFSPTGKILAEGDQLFIPNLSKTLQTLAETGSSLMRDGSLAQAFCHDQEVNGGLVTEQDLLSFQVFKRDALRIEYGEYEVILPPPCSLGGVLIAFTLKLLSGFDLAAYPANSAEKVRLLYEAMQATTRARVELEVAAATDDLSLHFEDFLAQSNVDRYLQEVKIAIEAEKPSVSSPITPSHPNTSHISVIDGNGMAISLTTTAGESAGYVVPGTGFIPNNMLGEADLNPHGWHKWRPGQRIPTMMTPALLLKDGNVVMATGSGGSERIRSAIIQVITNFADHQIEPQAAIQQPRVHVEKNVLQVEYGYQQSGINELDQMGYPVNRWQNPSMYFGGAHSAFSLNSGFVGAPDQRRDGYSIVI